MRLLFVLLLSLLFAGCNKPDPQPEKKDAIYLDMVTEMGIAEKNLVEAQKKLEEHKKDLESAIPQTGQIKFAQKRYFAAEQAVNQLQQQIKYWTIRTESRRNYIRKKCMEAFIKGESCINESEMAEYEAEKRLRRAKLNWDVKERREDFLKEQAEAKKASAAGAEGAAPSGGGH